MTLTIAVPSKGRLQENAFDYFAAAGLEIAQERGARDYRGAIAGLPGVEVAFLSASEIAAQLAAGGAHLGVTGEDLVREQVADADERLLLLTPLGFGRANVVVAAPQSWIDVKDMADLEDVCAHFRARRGERMRVATKYVNLTRRFFNAHHVTDYRIVESLGATEGAPAAGTAELIVDIATTGATLAANGLKVLEDGVILKSEANLVASLRANWDEEERRLARALLARLAATDKGRRSREVRAWLPQGARASLSEAAQTFSATLAQAGAGGGPASFLCPRGRTSELAEWLLANGAERVTVHSLEQAFELANPLYQALTERIGAGAG